MKNKIYIFLTFLAFGVCLCSTSAHSTQPLPKEFEAVYEEILNSPDYVSLGNPKGSYVIIDFFDYRCKFCTELHKDLSKLIKSKEGKNIRWISIEAPVFGYKHNHASNLILSAKKQNKYNQLFEKIAEQGFIDQGQMRKIFQSLGGDFKQLEKDATETDLIPTYEKRLKLYNSLNMRGVPILILNKKYQLGAFKDGQLEQVIKDANPPSKWKQFFLNLFGR